MILLDHRLGRTLLALVTLLLLSVDSYWCGCAAGCILGALVLVGPAED